jgi:thiol-disulfide isomerase/thioredoxin
MSRLLSALIDLLSGVLFVLIAFLSARVLLQDHSLVYLCFPLLTSVALAVGFWRGRKRMLPALVVALLITAPLLILALQFFSGRNRPFIIFPIVTFVFVCIGIAFARYRVMVAAIMAVIVIANIGGALVSPQFVHFIVASSDVNEKPVPFTIHLVDGTTISSEALRGNLVVLDFWATWCVPCQRELPLIQRAYQKLETGKGVVFIAVDGVMTDAPEDAGDTAERAIAYFRRGGFTIPLAWDGGAVLEKTFALRGFPALLVLDGAGSVRMRHTGFIGAEDLERTLNDKIVELQNENRH